MKRLSLLLATASLLLLVFAGSARASFGFESFESRLQRLGGAEESQAGAHPYEMNVDFDLRAIPHPIFGELVPDENLRNLTVDLPAGFVGDPTTTPTCSVLDLTPTDVNCPINSQIGIVTVTFAEGSAPPLLEAYPVFNIEPADNQVARFAFNPQGGTPVNIVAGVRSDSDYGVRTTMTDVPEALPFYSARLTLWGVPADPSHDALRGPDLICNGVDPALEPGGCEFGGESASIAPTVFLSNPTFCGEPLTTGIAGTAWQGGADSTSYTTASGLTGCDKEHFEPQITVRPTTHAADSPTGLDVDLAVPQNDNPVGVATAHVKDSAVKLPEGMTVNPSSADGLQGCPEADFGLHTKGLPSCPDASKIGTVEIDSSLVREPLHGSIYQAEQDANPSGSTLAFYTYAKGPGIEVKLAAKVVTDPVTGRVTTIFKDSPQLPFDHYKLHFNGGPRAALRTPPTCGTKTSEASLTSWAAPATQVQIADSFQITSGPNGTPCPDGLAGRPFAPRFEAGSQFPIAGAFSPFGLEISREDGSQELRTIETTLPAGVLARLAGVPYCPEATVAAISAAPGSGLGERLHPSCPAASLVGHVDTAAGAGALPFHNPGNVYLTGPRDGAPLSLAVVTPIVAGPLDLGSIVVRADLQVDPTTARVRVLSDPIPEKIVADGNGFPLNVRSVRVEMDRPQFTLNPTSCEATAVSGRIGSLQGATAEVSNRFQVGACAALGFKPKLALRLTGGTRRGGNPALRATLKMPAGDNANIARASVALPHSEFLEQAHIGTVCTRVQFAARACPPGSVYGHARAFTPLLDQPLEGPVYLRSSDHPLPDLVADLNGQIHVVLAGRIDSFRKGIRTSFETVPDAPVEKFVLTMRGGRKGLLVNSTDLCARTRRATVRMDAHNGRIHDFNPILKSSCGKKKAKHRPRPQRGG